MSRASRALAKAETTEQARALAAELLAGGALLGLLQADPRTWMEDPAESGGDDEEIINKLIASRNQARKNRDFQQADAIREQLSAMGITLEDVAGGTRWRREKAGS